MNASAAADIPIPEPDNVGRRSVHGATVTFGAQGFRFAMQFAFQVILARLLLPSEFGLIAMVAPITAFVVTLNQMGLLEATIQRRQISHGELSALFWVNVLVSCTLGVLLAAVAPLVGWFYGEPATVPIVISLSGLIVLNGLSAQHMALLNRNMRFTSLAAIDVTSTLISGVVSLGAAWAGWGVWSLVAMQAANTLTNTILAWALSGWLPSPPRRQRGVLEMLRFGGNVTGSNLIDFLAYSLDNVLIGATNSSFALGLYDRAFKLAFQPMLQLITPFSRVAVPLLSRQHDAPAQYVRSYVRMVQMTSLLVVPGLLVATVMSEEIVVVLLGPHWAAAGPLLAWVSAASLATPLLMSTTWLFVSQGRSREQLVWGGLGSGLRIVSFVIGLPWGPLGVAIAGAVVNCLLQTPMLCWRATRAGPVGPGRLIRELFPLVVGGITAELSLLAVRGTMAPEGILDIFAMTALSYAVHLAVLACLPRGQGMLRDIWGLRGSFRRAAA